MSKLQRFMKTKKGFTLVELMVVVAVLAILVAVAVPTYGYVQKQGRIDVCEVTRDSARHDLVVWAMQFPFNTDFSFKIESDGTSGTLVELNHGMIDSTRELIEQQIFKDGVPYCPCDGGTYTVICTQSSTRNYFEVEITCDGGTDGDCHK